jgi:hypothetical protein
MRRYALDRACALLLAASGCVVDSAEHTRASYPSAGLYTPGNTLGASDPTDMPQPGAGLGNRCVALPALDPAAGAPTNGTLELEYTTLSLMGRYAPKNCTAVWIETAAGQYVATIEIGAGLRRPGLVYWQDHGCTEKPGPDVVTSATLPEHEAHAATWKGLDFEGKPVADGSYALLIEVTESDKEPGELATFPFDKGAMPYERELPVSADGPLERVAIAWELTPEGSTGGTTGGD